jgi:hypothetical protein
MQILGREISTPTGFSVLGHCPAADVTLVYTFKQGVAISAWSRRPGVRSPVDRAPRTSQTFPTLTLLSVRLFSFASRASHVLRTCSPRTWSASHATMSTETGRIPGFDTPLTWPRKRTATGRRPTLSAQRASTHGSALMGQRSWFSGRATHHRRRAHDR